MTALLATATGFDLYGAVALIVGAPLFMVAVCRRKET